MAKFKKGQKCKVIHNLLAPHCIGDVVTIIEVMAEKDGHVMYRINEGGMEGFASESCLKEIGNMKKGYFEGYNEGVADTKWNILEVIGEHQLDEPRDILAAIVLFCHDNVHAYDD